MTNLLYIEDDMVDQIILKRLIRKKENIRYKIANDLSEAEDLIQKESFDFILSDYHLGGITVRKVLEKFSHLPIYLLSGIENAAIIKELYSLGLKGHMSKPFCLSDFEILLSHRPQTVIFNRQKTIPDMSLPVTLDFTELDKYGVKGQARLEEFVRIFVNVASIEKQKISHSQKNKDWKNIGLSVHMLRSNLRMLGFKQLYRKAEEIEGICAHPTTITPHVQKDISIFLNRLDIALEKAKEIL